METSDGGGIGVDCGVGTIVWVRRRNGSWWPGRILGLDELSTSHLMSPRSGTPVKLLGREDASVDWYNLEKSKRVKAFRCGEFDACIERAEASQSTPIKKREKYARREDAILHALELEKKQKLGVNSNGICTIPFGAYNREATALSSPETYIRHDKSVARGKLSSCKRESSLKKAAFSHEGVDTESPLYKEGSNQQFNLEHDNAEAITRMRGLHDFGIKLAHYKRKTTLSGNWENSCKSVNNVDSLSSSGFAVRGTDEASTSRNDSLVKKKRSYGSVIDEFIVKKRDRRRPLVQVLQSSAKLPFHSVQLGCSAADTLKNEETEKIGSTWTAKRSRSVCFSAELDGHSDHVLYASKHMSPISKQFEMCDGLSYSENKDEACSSSGLIEATDSDCCEADFSEPAMVEETDLLIGTADTLLPESKDCDPPEFQVSGDFRSLIQEDVPLSGFMFQLHGKAKHTSKVSVSKWRMKGKRNIRNVGKRLSDAADAKVLCPDLQRCNGPLSSTAYDGKDILKFSVAESPSHGPEEEEFEYACGENKDFDQSQLNSVYTTVQLNGTDFSLNNSEVFPHDLNPFWEEPLCQAYTKDANSEMEPLLVDVDLRVQTSYQGEHVPLVSLMSRLNGKAIIGHPVQIEILEEGSAGLLVSAHDAVMDENTATQAVWRTARRTAMQRVPRSIPLTTSLEEDDNGTFPSHKEPYYHYLKHQMRTIKKGTSLIHRRSGLRKFQKKAARRVSASSKKTRTLSSLASEEKTGGEYDGQKLDPSNDILEGLIKAEGAVPLVTCIPVKVVFSRILEAVSRHRMRMSSPGSQGS